MNWLRGARVINVILVRELRCYSHDLICGSTRKIFSISQRARETISLRQWDSLSPFLFLFSTRVINFLPFLPAVHPFIMPTSLFSSRYIVPIKLHLPYPTFYCLSLSLSLKEEKESFPRRDKCPLLFSSYGRPSRPLSISPADGPREISNAESGSEMRKCARSGTNKAACIPTHGSHISPQRVHETAHRRRLPLTDPRIHEWSVGYQWAARCYPHAQGPLFPLSSSPVDPSCAHAIARAATCRDD